MNQQLINLLQTITHDSAHVSTAIYQLLRLLGKCDLREVDNATGDTYLHIAARDKTHMALFSGLANAFDTQEELESFLVVKKNKAGLTVSALVTQAQREDIQDFITAVVAQNALTRTEIINVLKTTTADCGRNEVIAAIDKLKSLLAQHRFRQVDAENSDSYFHLAVRYNTHPEVFSAMVTAVQSQQDRLYYLFEKQNKTNITVMNFAYQLQRHQIVEVILSLVEQKQRENGDILTDQHHQNRTCSSASYLKSTNSAFAMTSNDDDDGDDDEKILTGDDDDDDDDEILTGQDEEYEYDDNSWIAHDHDDTLDNRFFSKSQHSPQAQYPAPPAFLAAIPPSMLVLQPGPTDPVNELFNAVAIARELLGENILLKATIVRTTHIKILMRVETLVVELLFTVRQRQQPFNAPTFRIVNQDDFPQTRYQQEVLVKTTIAACLPYCDTSKKGKNISWANYQELQTENTDKNKYAILLALQNASNYLQQAKRYLSRDESAVGKDSEKKIDNFFVQFHLLLQQKLVYNKDHEKEHCIICYDSLKIKQDVKYLTCDKEFCRWQAEQLGLANVQMIQYAKDFPQVLDFLICMTYAACSSHRRDLIFDPFPEEFIPHKGSRDYDALLKTLKCIPAVDRIAAYATEEALKLAMQYWDAKAYKLLRWIVMSNRAHIIALPVEAQFQSYVNHEFQVEIADPTREALFRAHRTKYANTLFAFHGSSLENWHAIIRKGLRNLSGTQLQVNGAFYGAGVYLAADIYTSYAYTVPAEKWPNSRLFSKSNGSSRLSCISQVELIQYEGLQPSGVYVVQDDSFIKVSKLLV